MERLTKRVNDVLVYTQGQYEIGTLPVEMESWDVRKVLERLEQYEDAEEQGLLLRLPCKVGDTLYEVRNGNILSYSLSREWRIARYLEEGFFRTSVFLTREEAEQALAEMEK